MQRAFLRLSLLLVLALSALPGCGRETPSAGLHSPTATQGLPTEALETLNLIQQGGPFPHAKDGTVFQNRERRLPIRPQGYYREYTVTTPGSWDRGARRIITGGNPPREFYYSPDHYRSFRSIEVHP